MKIYIQTVAAIHEFLLERGARLAIAPQGGSEVAGMRVKMAAVSIFPLQLPYSTLPNGRRIRLQTHFMDPRTRKRDVESTLWDAIVIGTGMGGAIAGYRLAQAGKRVLFIEKGRSLLDPVGALKGDFAENFISGKKVAARRERSLLERAGRAFETVTDVSMPARRSFIPFIGCGTGGSTTLYGAALERFFPSDFSPGRFYSGVPGSAIPDRWPVTYEEFRPYYKWAERLFRLPDAEDERSPLSKRGVELKEFLERKGLHPYRMPIAVDRSTRCLGCQGFICAFGCKRTSADVALRPALERYGARLLERCEAMRLEAGDGNVTSVVCRWRNKTLALKARTYILAAGALETPRLLLRSASTTWRTGLANRSGLVGRHLMRHFVDLYVVFPKASADPDINPKELAINDFYQDNGRKLGTVQNFGRLVSASMLADEFEERVREGRGRALLPLFAIAKPLLKSLWNLVLKKGVVFASILEDLPYPDNRVYARDPDAAASPDGRFISYRIRDFDQGRIALFRKMVLGAFRPYRTILIKQAENNERLAHACGTCRFGDDPRTSVLNRWNRAHDVANLYVVDASFFPSSAGTNPGLTLAANALRVADHIVAEEKCRSKRPSMERA